MARRLTSALEPEPTWTSQARKALPLVAALAVLAIAAVLIMRSGGTTPTTAPTATTPGTGTPATQAPDEGSELVTIDLVTGELLDTPWEGETTTIELYLDGWSWRTLGRDDIEFQVVTDVPEAVSIARFVPLDKDEVATAITQHPQMAQALLGRLATVQKSVICSQGNCAIDGNAIDAAEWLANPSTIPTWGASYKGWQIPAGLYRARVAVPVNATSLTLESPNWKSSHELALSITTAPGIGGTVVPPRPYNGWLEGGYLLSAAFGLLFPTTADWTGGENAVPFTRADLPAPDGVEDRPVRRWDALRLASGLRDTRDAGELASLSSSQLTYLSSPTSGCGVAVVCVPDLITVTASDLNSTSATVCDTTGGVGRMTFTTATVTADLPAPTHLAGVWGETTPDTFANAKPGSSVLPFSGYPPLAEGKATWRQGVLVLLDAAGGVIGISGSRNNAGPLQVQALNVPEHFGGTYKECTAQAVLQ